MPIATTAATARPVSTSIVVCDHVVMHPDRMDMLGAFNSEAVEHDEAGATQRITLRKPTTYHDEAVALDQKLSAPGSFNVKLKANGDLIGQRAFMLVTA